MKYTVEIGGRAVVVEVDDGEVRVDGRPVDATLMGSGATRRLVRGRLSREFVATGTPLEDGQWRLLASGYKVDALVLDARTLAVRAGSRGRGPHLAGTLKAPMPGLVVRVLVKEGDEVETGRGLVVLEAMKMENELKAPGAGTVKTIHVAAGAKVERGSPLVELT